jgi:hypothetical protein
MVYLVNSLVLKLMAVKSVPLKEIEVFMVAKIHVVFWIVTLCSDVVGYQCFGGSCFLHLQGEDNSEDVDLYQLTLISSQL